MNWTPILLGLILVVQIVTLILLEDRLRPR